MAPPDAALMSAWPDWPLAENLAVATPLSVRTCNGLIAPSVVVKVTVVPFWTGVPACSSTVALISAVPFAWTMVLLAERVIVDRLGASRGSLSQTEADSAKAHRTTAHARFLAGHRRWLPRRHEAAMINLMRYAAKQELLVLDPGK